MINALTVTNHLGESLTINVGSPDSSGFLIRPPIEGLTPPKADINTIDRVTDDGSVFNSKHVGMRNIVLTLGFNANPTIEATRHACYKYFPIGKPVLINVVSDDRNCYAYGHVESNEPDIFSKEQGAVISILCPESYLYSLTNQITLFSGTINTFEFPFSNESLSNNLISFGTILSATEKSVYYQGDAPTGLTMYIHILGTVTNLKIMDYTTQQLMKILNSKLPGGQLIAGDDIVISTAKGAKYVTLTRSGVEYNILGALEKGYSWFQLDQGDNVFAYVADSGVSNVQFRVENQVVYGGI